jgi:hypothetical protein
VEIESVRHTYTYHERILEELARYGLVPLPSTPPARLRDALRDLYKYEIKVLRDRLLAGGIERRNYADHVVELRKRYWLLSVPTELWTVTVDGGSSPGEAPSTLR